MIDAVLRGYQGVVAANTGHVAVHEAGAIEFGGHKVLTVPQERGKVSAAVLNQSLLDIENDGSYEHMVHPGLVYISRRLNTARFTRKPSLKRSARCVTNISSRSLSTARVLATHSRRPRTTSR